MKLAAYQAPLLAAGSMDALGLIRTRIEWCEAEGITILCCPEAILGGLADYSENPNRFAIRSDEGHLASALAPLASDSVTSIIGFSELASDGALYNAAAIFQRARVVGLYRKVHPAIRRSVYAAGSEAPVFRVGELTFGVVICNDSNDLELARRMTAQGATVLFVPTNNGLPNQRACPKLNGAARDADIALAVANRIWVIRSDVSGRNGELTSYGSSEIVDPGGNVIRQAHLQSSDMLVAEIADAKCPCPQIGRGNRSVTPDFLLPPSSKNRPAITSPLRADLTWQGKLIETRGVTPSVPVVQPAERLLLGKDRTC